MAFLIDTNIFIYARDGNDRVLGKFGQHAGKVSLSAISLAELQRGLLAGQNELPLRLQRHEALVRRMAILSFDAAAGEAYRRVIAAIGRTKSRDVDHLIAAHALSIGATLVTNNTADFLGIPGLATENWATP